MSRRLPLISPWSSASRVTRPGLIQGKSEGPAAYPVTMNRARLAFLFVVLSSVSGCGMVQMHQPGMGGAYGGGGPQAAGAAPEITIPKETQEQLRKMSADSDARMNDTQDEQLDRLEKDALKAVRSALGQEKWADHLPMPLPASQSILALRKQNVKMKLEPVLNPVSGQANEDFLQFKDESTDRLGMLSRKSAEGTANAAERKEMMGYQKISFKLMDVRMQVLNSSLATMQANSNVQTSGMMQMLNVSSMVRIRRLYNMDIDANDIAAVKRGLARQKRAEAIAAVSMAMTAAYQAVLNNGGDPKAIDVIAEGSLKAFPIKPNVTDDEAKKYVASLGENVKKTKAGYERMLRKAWGDAKYDRQLKQGIDAMFQQAEDAEKQQSVNQIAQANMAAYRRNATAAQQQAQAQRAAKANEAARETSGGDGDVLDTLSKLLGENSTVGASLQGISALKKGDAKGAINAALSFAPPGVKDAFSLASKLLFKG